MKKIILIGTAMIGLLVSAKPASTVWEEHPKSYTEGVLVKCPHCSYYLPGPKVKLTAKQRASFTKTSKKLMQAHVNWAHENNGAGLKASKSRVNAAVAKSSRKSR